MQREKINAYPKIKRYKPILFWEECRFCHKEFKKEYGFIIKEHKKCRASNEEPIYTSYCCSKCASTIDEVIQKLEKSELDLKKIRPQMPGSGIK